MAPPPVDNHFWLPYTLAAAVFAAATALLGKVGVSEINSNLATVFRTAVVLLVAAALVTARGEWESPARESRFGLLMLTLSGVTTGLSWLCYYRALRFAPASVVAPIDKLSVALVIVLSVALLGEPLTWRLAAGGGLITAGVLVLARV